MAVPTTRKEFADYCLRKLGAPVIEINVSEEQVDDRIDEALKMFADYHFDGNDRVYFKHRVTSNDRPGAINSITVIDGGIGYSNTDIVTTSSGTSAELSLTTDNAGTILSVNIDVNGSGFSESSQVNIQTTTGSGASIKLIPGDGSILLPDNIMGAVAIFPISDPFVSSDDMFSIRYQIALNDLYSLTSVSMVPYFMTMQHLALIQEMLVGKQPIRYNRFKNRVYIDMDWGMVRNNQFLIIEAYEVIDPDVYNKAWGDRWLQNYATAKIKLQWASNMGKFTNMVLPGGIQFNSDRIAQEAQQEIDKIEEEMHSSIVLPSMDFWG